MSLDQLKAYGLTPQTMVWHDGLPTWVAASALPELAPLFNPYPTENAETQEVSEDCLANPAPPKPPTYLVWSIICMLLLCLLPGIVAVIFASQVSSRYNMGDYEGAQRASSRAELWLILTIVIGLVWTPFSLVLQMMV